MNHKDSSNRVKGNKEESTMNGLSVGDGFKFGCGFFIAGFITWLVIVVTMVLFMTVFSGLLAGMMDRFGDLSQLLLLLPVV
jgi:hypothetical protein